MDIPKGGDRVLVAGALLLFGFALNALITYQPAYEGPGGLVSIGSVDSDGPVRRRHAGSLAWSEIDGEGEIYLRDLVYTPQGTEAVVKMKDGRTVTLPPDSLVQFDDVTVSNLEISLREISSAQTFRLVPLPKARLSMTLPDVLPLELAFNDLAAKFKAAPTRLTGLVPAKTVAANPDFKLNQLQDFEIKLAYPPEGASLPYVRDDWTKMAWSAVPLKGVSYQIEMSLKQDFGKKVPYESRTNSLEIQFDKPGKYYWRVVAAGTGGIMTSEVRTFTLFPRGHRDFASDVTAQDFSEYFVEVATSDDFDPVLTSRGSKEPKCGSVGLPPGTYYCRVKMGKNRTIKEVFKFDVR